MSYQYQNPPSQPPVGGGSTYYPSPRKDTAPTLSNTASMITVGLMFFVAAAGVWALFSTGLGFRIVVGTIGAIVLIAGVLLAWAALTGHKAGWFLWFSVAGAALVLPALLIGLALSAGLDELAGREYAPPGAQEVVSGSSTQTGRGGHPHSSPHASSAYLGTDVINLDDESAYVDHRTTSVLADDSRLVWDLTNASTGSTFELTASESVIDILLTPKQLPVIEDWTKLGVYFSAESSFDEADNDALSKWVDAGFPADSYPHHATDTTVQKIDIDIAAEESAIRFIVVAEPKN